MTLIAANDCFPPKLLPAKPIPGLMLTNGLQRLTVSRKVESLRLAVCGRTCAQVAMWMLLV